uniref:F-box protein AT5G49610-like beta-propeller domain-containing protein n=1 Tax=Aegilops tauschii TaxID=37682 RepID=M8C1H9_AEGTA
MAFVCGCCCFRVNPAPNLTCVDGKRLRQSATPADPVCKVLGDDNLLIEILLLICYPTTLVRAGLVYKRWLCHASDPAFLCRFRTPRPPRLLGFYVDTGSYIGDPGSKNIVLSPLCPERGMVVIPPYPRHKLQDGYFCTFSELFLKERGNDLSYFCVLMESSKERTKSTVHMYMLQDGVWCVHASATTQLPFLPQELNPLLVGNKIYMAATPSEILVLDLTALSFSTFQLPQGLVISDRRTMLSRADDDSGVYLIHLNEFQLRIWLHTGENCLLMDTICLREMCAKWRVPDHTHEVSMKHVGRNAEFVFLEMGPCLLYLGIKCRTLCKVYERTNEIPWLGFIHPYMMIWPPTFPVLKDDPARCTTMKFFLLYDNGIIIQPNNSMWLDFQ